MSTLITEDRLKSIVSLLKKAPHTGAIAEVGVYKGGSLKVIAQAVPNRPVLGFDTFEGLPKEQWTEGELHKPGDFSDVTLESVYQFVKDTPNIILIKGLFPASGDAFKHMQFAFVHIDTDFYEGVKQSLEWVWPRLVVGGIVVFDDYEWSNCPGVKRALEEFGQPVRKGANYQAYLIKP
jgi:O-methyltransferase